MDKGSSIMNSGLLHGC